MITGLFFGRLSVLDQIWLDNPDICIGTFYANEGHWVLENEKGELTHYPASMDLMMIQKELLGLKECREKSMAEIKLFNLEV